MRVAFIIQTHLGNEQVRRLLQAINAGCADRVILLSYNGDPEQVRSAALQQNVDALLRAVASARGRFGLVQSYIEALRWLYEHSIKYDWVVHLSGQDYPTAPLRTLQNYLETSRFDGFFYHFDPFDRKEAGGGRMQWGPDEAYDRYFFRYRLLRSEIGVPWRAALWIPRRLLASTNVLRIHTSFGLMLGVRPRHIPFFDGIKLYAGSFWQIVNKRCVEAILEEDECNKDLKRYFQDVILPDESYLQTILLNRTDLKISSCDPRYYDFSGQRHGSSRTLQFEDLTKVLEGKYFFARKFDLARHPTILDEVDRHLLAGRTLRDN